MSSTLCRLVTAAALLFAAWQYAQVPDIPDANELPPYSHTFKIQGGNV